MRGSRERGGKAGEAGEGRHARHPLTADRDARSAPFSRGAESAHVVVVRCRWDSRPEPVRRAPRGRAHRAMAQGRSKDPGGAGEQQRAALTPVLPPLGGRPTLGPDAPEGSAALPETADALRLPQLPVCVGCGQLSSMLVPDATAATDTIAHVARAAVAAAFEDGREGGSGAFGQSPSPLGPHAVQIRRCPDVARFSAASPLWVHTAYDSTRRGVAGSPNTPPHSRPPRDSHQTREWRAMQHTCGGEAVELSRACSAILVGGVSKSPPLPPMSGLERDGKPTIERTGPIGGVAPRSGGFVCGATKPSLCPAALDT